jgi:small subunit ribosomal protein S4
MYGLLERQFRRYFALATRQKGMTGLNLLRLLEGRLDNVIFRLGLAASRDQARQLVRHGHINVNKRRVNIPSFNVKVGTVIEVSPKAKEYKIFKENLEQTRERVRPTWLEFDEKNLSGKVLRLPARDDITASIQENLIVELYSR